MKLCFVKSVNSEQPSRYKLSRVELTFSASDNDDAPDSPILLKLECDMIINNEWNIMKSKVQHRFNWIRDELTFSTDDNDDAPDEQILL